MLLSLRVHFHFDCDENDTKFSVLNPIGSVHLGSSVTGPDSFFLFAGLRILIWI
jgi:hypothetical protein